MSDPDSKEAKRLREELEKARKRIEELERENSDLARKKGKLEQENKELKDQLSRVMGSAPMLAASDKTAEAGGVPSSKVFYRRPVDQTEKKPTGGQVGHKGHARAKPAPNAPPVNLTLSHCPKCEGELGAPCDELVRTVTDIPVPQLLVYEVRTSRYKCPHCKMRVHAEPFLPPNQQFGAYVAAWIAYHRMLGLSMDKVLGSLVETFGLKMSEQTGYDLEAWVSKCLGPMYEELRKQIQKAPVVGADESKFRINGENGWLWTIVSELISFYEIHNTRGKNAIMKMLPDFEGVIVRDAWDPYDQLTKATHQLDILHVNRWYERVEVMHGIEPRKLVKIQSVKFTRAGRPPKELLKFIDGGRERFREAILFVDKQPSAQGRERAYVRYRRSMFRFLNRPWKHKDAVRIRNELRGRIDMLFTFVRIPGVPWHNNDAERSIRQGVLHRKISGGRRTWPGAAILSTLMSVFETCKKTKKNFLTLAQGLLAPDAPSSAGPQS